MEIIEKIIEKITEIIKKIFYVEDNKNYKEYNYQKKEYMLTQTELKFYKVLKQVTDELNLIICPQVSLYEIIKSNNYKEFNKISRKTIDFVITKQNLKILYCIELDDYTHKYNNRIQRDDFVNQIFKETNIKLIRFPVKQYYTIEEIKKALPTDI